ncbi:2-amino-4-hydroxy-6-hydroxymethyldihydropteridine diphosphokinase [Colwellia asteriadis]|uniref:2-amino-4-hydroxy-6-hydroxymethyldihydropteridine diphosphokinase n=1 Tax=Colwellia asteriadis TaxID=517723 RepID=A0ABN1L302_9GAMM
MATIYISLGSNINREKNVKQGIEALTKAFGTLTLSSLFESKAIGFSGAAFYNMVIGIETNKNIEQVTATLREIEFANGRSFDAKKFSPRTLDLDLLLFDDLICEHPAQLPRAEITTNAFVLWPLSQVAPNLLHPILNKSYHELWQNYDKKSQQLAIIEPCW